MGPIVRCIVLVVAGGLTLAAQEPASQKVAQVQDEAITIETPHGPLATLLRVPAGVARPPIVLLATIGGIREAELINALDQAGIASLRATSPRTEKPGGLEYAYVVTYLRNRSEQFPTVTVFAEGPGLPHGIAAARLARADAVYITGEIGRAFPEEFQSLTMKTGSTPGGSAAADGAKLAEFVATVVAYGRRGGPANRPAQARRSPRQLTWLNIGPRISVEWGSPQKRGREVWGSLVKWDAVWMPGADEATTLTTNGPITLSSPGLASLQVPAGDYTLYTLPGAGRFELIVSRDVGQFHTVHVADRELGRLVMQRADREAVVEGLTFALERSDGGALLKLMWDNREYFVQVTTNK